MFATGEFWVLTGLIIFIGIAIYMKVPGMLVAGLDKRREDIANELEEARRLREEAQQLLASYQRKQREAMKEAEDIVTQAKAEAERLAAETRSAMTALVARRTKMADDKIAQAEAQAMADIRAVASDVAIAAAREIIAAKVDVNRDAKLVEGAIATLASKLH